MLSSLTNAQDALSIGAKKSKKFYTLQVPNVKIERNKQTGEKELAAVYTADGGYVHLNPIFIKAYNP